MVIGRQPIVVDCIGTATIAVWVIAGLVFVLGVAVLLFLPLLMQRAIRITVLGRETIAHSIMAQFFNFGAAGVRLPEVMVENPPGHRAAILVLHLHYEGASGAEQSSAHTYFADQLGMGQMVTPAPKPHWYDRCEHDPVVVDGGETKVFGVVFGLNLVAPGKEQIGLSLEIEDRISGKRVRLLGPDGTCEL